MNEEKEKEGAWLAWEQLMTKKDPTLCIHKTPADFVNEVSERCTALMFFLNPKILDRAIPMIAEDDKRYLKGSLKDLKAYIEAWQKALGE